MERSRDLYHGLEVRLRIFDALYREVCEPGNKALNDVTVKRICDLAGVSRPTFYYYFSDKYSVVSWVMEMIGESTLREIGLTMGISTALRTWIVAVDEYREFFARCYRSRFYQDVYTRMVDLLREALERGPAARYGNDFPKKLKFEARYYGLVIEAAAADWMRGKLDVDADELVSYIMAMIDPELLAILEEPASGGRRPSFLELAQTVHAQGAALS